jgi:type II secretory pathway component GspD/PulD (secretin)
MKIFTTIATILFLSTAFAEEKMNFNYLNEDITKIIENYSKTTKTRMVIDSTVRGNITLLNPSELTYDEALNQLAEALAINGFSMNKRDDYYIIRNARSAQRDALEVSTSLPSLKPQRMASWIVTLKNTPAAELNANIGRVMSSSYGEMTYNRKSNQLIISDFTSSLHRVNSMLLEFDRTEDPKLLKMAEENRKVEDRMKKSIDDTEKLSDLDIKIKKSPAKPAAAAEAPKDPAKARP